MIAIAPYPIRILLTYLFIPSMILPIKPLILQYDAILIAKIIPEVRNNTDTYSHSVPINRLWQVYHQLLHPFPIPSQRLTIRVLKETLKRDIGAS